MSLAGNIQLTDQDVRSTTTSKPGERLGQQAKTADGRTWALGLNGSGSTALSAGKLTQGAVSASNYVNRTGVTTTAGQQTVTFTLGTTATADQFADAYLYVNAGTGAGQYLLIAGNTAATAGSSNATTLYLYDAVITATSSSDSKFSIQPNPYSACLISDHTAPTSVLPTGVPTVSVPASSYAWFQIGGPASVLANGTPGVGVAVIPGATTDGSVDVATGAITQPFVGYCLITAVSTEYRSIFLTINPA